MTDSDKFIKICSPDKPKYQKLSPAPDTIKTPQTSPLTSPALPGPYHPLPVPQVGAPSQVLSPRRLTCLLLAALTLCALSLALSLGSAVVIYDQYHRIRALSDHLEELSRESREQSRELRRELGEGLGRPPPGSAREDGGPGARTGQDEGDRVKRQAGTEVGYFICLYTLFVEDFFLVLPFMTVT